MCIAWESTTPALAPAAAQQVNATHIGTFKLVQGDAWIGADAARRAAQPGAGVIARAQARAGGEIVITSHTDHQGLLDANDRLPLERAQAVRARPIERGFAPDRIDVVGRGECEPVVPTEDGAVEPRTAAPTCWCDDRQPPTANRQPQNAKRKT